MNRIQAKKLQADIDKRAEEVVLKLQRKGIIVKPLSAPLETIALAAGATVVDGESITFSVEAWSKFRVALGAPLPQTLVLKATLRQLVDEVKRHAYAPQFQHMGPLVMEAEALLAKDAPSVPTMAAPASAPTERDDCTYPSCQCDGFAVRCPLQKRT